MVNENTAYIAHYVFDDPNYRADHGIKGQRWGIRRYQNSDGSLTAEGKSRYSSKDISEDIDNMRTFSGRRQYHTSNQDSQDITTLKKSYKNSKKQNPSYNKDAIVDVMTDDPKVTSAVSRLAKSTGKSETEIMSGVVNGKYAAEVNGWEAHKGVYKKALIIGVSAAALAAGGAYYATHKNECDAAISSAIKSVKSSYDTNSLKASKVIDKISEKESSFSSSVKNKLYSSGEEYYYQKQRKATGEYAAEQKAKTKAYVEDSDNKKKILRDPKLIKKYQEYLTDKDLADAANNLNNLDRINTSRRNQVAAGADYINSILKYGTVAVSAYGIYNSQLGKDVRKKVAEKKKENQNGQES